MRRNQLGVLRCDFRATCAHVRDRYTVVAAGHIKRFILSLLLVGGIVSAARADVRLPAVFSDHAVLQCDAPVPVWGWADGGEKVTVSIAGQSKQTTAGVAGKWSLRLDPMAAGGPHELVVEAGNTIRLADVLVGEVWLGSGQSNMAMTVARSANAEEEIASAKDPKIRMFTVERSTATEPQEDCQGQWQVCSPETVGQFSATAYFFGRTLRERLGVPVGLINSSWGGTPVEAWTSLEAQRSVPAIEPVLAPWEKQIADYDPDAAQAAYEQALARWKKAAEKAKTTEKAKAAGRKPPRRPRPPADPRTAPHRPANLYNGMIAPLVPYAVGGAIWYQGERNSRDELSRLYGSQLQTLIANWRDLWGQGDFPFGFVQLPNFMAPQQEPSETTGWVMVREGMLKTLSLANTGMAVTLDVGEAGDIHPKNKQDVGKRLAFWALATTYEQDVVACGPIYKSMSGRNGRITIAFDHVGGGLVARGGGPLRGFAVAESDRKFVWAEAEIEGDTVVVSCPKVDRPVAVRYAWANNPDANLTNRAGLPASPFRTDDWIEPI
ncbi:MAG: sialate O-acetylesterase, partial [Planctomycetota bacterium]